MGLASNYAYEGGYRQPMIIAWIHSQTYIGIDTIANVRSAATRFKDTATASVRATVKRGRDRSPQFTQAATREDGHGMGPPDGGHVPR